MRLFKFLVISDEVMKKRGMVKPIQRMRIEYKDGAKKLSKLITTKNKFYFFCSDLDKINTDILSQHNIKDSQQGMVLMSIDYINERAAFRENNKAYVIIDANNVDEVMKLIAPTEKRSSDYFQGCSIKVCNDCNDKNSKPCSNISMDIIEDKRYVRGKAWSYANDTAGTKVTIPGIIRDRTIEPKTGGIVYASIHWRKDLAKNGKVSFKPEGFEGKAVYIPLHHWIKCNSVPNRQHQKGKYPFYHIGHIFDYRNDFIGLDTKEKIDRLREADEPQNEIRRGRRVLAAQENFSRYSKCKEECFNNSKEELGYISNPKCRDCEGVLYIDTEQGLVDLYNQLTSDEYRQLRE